MLNDLRNRPLLLALIAFIVGTLFGWWVLGWGLFPVEYKDADPHGLSQTYKEQYIAAVADSYAVNQDAALARQRLQSFSPDELSALLSTMKSDAQRDRKDQVAVSLQRLADGLGVKVAGGGTPAPGATSVAGNPPVAGNSNASLGLILGLLGLIFIIAGAAGILYFFLSRRPGEEPRRPAPQRVSERVAPPVTTAAPEPAAAVTQAPVVEAVEGEAPLGHFVTTYKLGDDGYDTSFSIETPSGEFLGECGVGISDVVGEGPQKVTAFEVWLFDKNEIKTVTKVLMSEYAYNNDQIRKKLVARGDAVPADKGRELALETEALRVLAVVSDMAYGTSGSPQSFFSRLTIELAPTIKAKVPA